MPSRENIILHGRGPGLVVGASEDRDKGDEGLDILNIIVQRMNAPMKREKRSNTQGRPLGRHGKLALG